MKTLAKILLLAGVMGNLVACVGGAPDNNLKTPASTAAIESTPTATKADKAPQGPGTWIIKNLAQVAFKAWMKSEFAKASELHNHSKAASFEQMEAQFSILNAKIDQLLQQQAQTYVAVNQLSNYMQKMALNDLNNSFMKMQNRNQTFYFAFTSTVQNQTGGEFFSWEQISESPTIMHNLANGLGCVSGAGGHLSCAIPINLMINDTLNIVGKGNQGGEIIGVSNFASQLFSSIQTYSLQNFPTLGSNNPNYTLGSNLQRNNESIMAYLGQMVNLLQQDYTMLNTLLYLRYFAPTSAGFSTITIPIPGFNSYNTYEQNKQAIDVFYESQIKTLQQNAQSYLISDNPLQPESAGIYKNAKTLPGVTGGNWNKGCNIYVWSGASNESNMGYTLGNFTGSKISQALCHDKSGLAIGKYDIDVAASCNSPQNSVSWYYGKNPHNQIFGTLQCDNFKPNYGSGQVPSWNDSGAIGSYRLTEVLSAGGAFLQGRIGISLTNPQTSMYQLSGFYQGAQYGFQHGFDIGSNRDRDSFFRSVFQYRTSDGLNVALVNMIQRKEAVTFGLRYYTQIQCLNHDVNCKQIAPLTLCVGNDKIHMAYYKVQLSASDSESIDGEASLQKKPKPKPSPFPTSDGGSLIYHDGKCN